MVEQSDQATGQNRRILSPKLGPQEAGKKAKAGRRIWEGGIRIAECGFQIWEYSVSVVRCNGQLTIVQ